MKKYLIIGIVLIIICIGFTISIEIRKNNINYINIHDITNSASKIEGVYVSLDATYVAGTIMSDSNNSFYVMFGDGVQYIVYINNKDAVKINKYLLDNPDDSYHIEGITKLIPKTMEEKGKKFVNQWLDNNHTHDSEEEAHSHDITTDEFYHYFGYVYLDNTINEDSINRIIIYLTGITGILFISFYVNTKFHLL